MKYYFLSNITRMLLSKLRKYHADSEQLLVFSQDFIGEEIFSYGVYERYEIACTIKALDFKVSENNILDIGANIGNHTVQFSKHFKNVFSFEPNPVVYKVLELNCRNRKNIQLYNFGLSNSNSDAYLNIPDGNFGGASVSKNSDNASHKIELRRLDDGFDHSFAMVKIDVEGHELEALRGMAGLINKNKPILCLELINAAEAANELINLLQGFGYDKFYIPHVPRFRLTRKLHSHFWRFLEGMFLKPSYKMVRIESFDEKFYNLVVFEHGDSNYGIKPENIKR